MKLKFSPENTQVLYFLPYTTTNPRLFIRFMGKIIKRMDHFKYLRITIDRNLNWSTHINETRVKMLKVSNRLRSIGA